MAETSLAPDTQARPISGLFAKSFRDISAGRVRLPSMPDVAIRLRSAMQQPNVTVAEAARIVQADPSTAGYLIAVANSPIYRGLNPISSVEQGVMRLGLVTTRNLVMAHSMRAMFTTRSASLARALRQTWMRSARTAAFAALLAKHAKGISPDQALLAGLVMDMGCLPLLRALNESKLSKSDAGADPERVYASLERYAPQVGVIVLEKWTFDPALVEVVRHRHDFARAHDGPGDLTDLSIVARRLALVGQEGALTLPTVEELPAFQRLDLGDLTVRETIDMLLAADADMRDVMQLLGVSI